MTKKEHDEKIDELRISLVEAEKQIRDIREELDKLDAVKVESRRWKPEYGDDYYYISPGGKVCHDKWSEHNVDFNRYAMGNVFKTEEEAEFEIERLKVIAELKEFAEPEDREWNSLDAHYTIIYNHNMGNLSVESWSVLHVGSIYFESREQAGEAINAVGEDRIKKYYLRVKE